MTPATPPVVDVAWVAGHPSAVLVDARSYVDGRSGQDAYAQGHLPGAVHVGLEPWLSAPPSDSGGRHPLPAPEVFAEGMAQAGIGDDRLVVAHDDAGGVIAARLVWMLRATGHEAALLDGGLLDPHVVAALGPLVREVPTPARVDFTARPWPAGLLVDADEVAGAPGVLLDARPADRYAGEPDPLDPRAGHVPGARSLPCRENVDAVGRLLPVEVLRARLAAVGVTDGVPVVSSCGSGVTACHTLLVLEHVGLGTARLWPGSWSQWSRTGRPGESGPRS